jgi:Zn-dependent peptidase ImmA (M78 family)
MALDEFSVVLKAREFVRKANVTATPVPLEPYLAAARATLREMADMAADEAGACFPMSNGTYRICVNAHDRVERRRFTVCHEIGHIVLGLRSDHKTQPWTTGRPLPETLCDLFAAQLLLPDHLFEHVAEEAELGLTAIDALAERFVTSVTATGSRFAESISTPCAFVLAHHGKIVHAARSKALRDARAVIARQIDLPTRSVSARARAGDVPQRQEIDAADWFSNWENGGVLLEEARHLAQWDQTLTLLWF